MFSVGNYRSSKFTTSSLGCLCALGCCSGEPSFVGSVAEWRSIGAPFSSSTISSSTCMLSVLVESFFSRM